MTKPISKSASGTRKASSPSGTVAKTGATASRSRPKPTGKFAFILERFQNKTPAQLRVDLIKAGVITESGQLTAKYKLKPKAKKRVAGSQAPST